MRTGTHYFPRGVNAVAAVERSRQKFGLNKIEETVGETMCTTSITATAASNAIISNHRRTESCDLSNRRQSSATNAIKAIATAVATTTATATTAATSSILGNINNNCNGITGAPIVSKEMSSLLQENTQSRMSPDLQRHLAYQTYRGFECKSINDSSCILTALLIIKYRTNQFFFSNVRLFPFCFGLIRFSSTAVFFVYKNVTITAPSPRQRCRIKTNPWLSTPETNPSAVGNCNSMMKRMEIDTSSTSSGIKSSSDAGTDEKKRYTQRDKIKK